MSLQTKKKKLISYLAEFRTLGVAFSGGVDSSFLLSAAHEVLNENLLAITSVSPVHPAREIKSASKFAKQLGVKHITLNTQELNSPEFLGNTKQRCYICKKIIISDFIRTASEMGVRNVAHGANLDDLDDFRPGNAAAEEMGILSPLVEAGMTKEDIRALSKQMGLPTWNRPALACLATRIPYGTQITLDDLKMVEKAEEYILDLGFTNCRVRHNGGIARIEVEADEIPRILERDINLKINTRLLQSGFRSVLIDMEGYIPSGFRVKDGGG